MTHWLSYLIMDSESHYPRNTMITNECYYYYICFVRPVYGTAMRVVYLSFIDIDLIMFYLD